MFLKFNRISKTSSDNIGIEIDRLVIAGWTGRNMEAIEHHIEELAALGIARPSTTPLFYRIGAETLVQGDTLSVLGPDSSGEVEPVVVSMADGLWVGIGSDHTDRKAEAQGIALSKQLCGKPVGGSLWRYDEIEDHWDDLVIRSWLTMGRERVLYQDSPISALRTPLDLIQRFSGADTLPAGSAMFCGTPGAIGDVRPASRFEMEIQDPILHRSLSHSYNICELPVIS